MANFPIVDKLGGRSATLEKLSAYFGRRLSRNVVNNWHERGFIPLDKVAALRDCAEAESITYDRANDFGPPPPTVKPDSDERPAA